MNKQELLLKLGMKDPFDGFVSKEGTQLWGWNGDSAIFGALIQEVKPKLIVEVGSWMGQSSVNMASCVKRLELGASVICVDTWLGSEEHWADSKLIGFLELENGYPTFFKRFMSNVKNHNCQDVVFPLPMPSQIAACYLRNRNLKADLIYVDGSHAEKDVYDDLTAYWELLNPGGIVFGDDWPWDSVSNAVKAFCAGAGVQYEVNGINWVLRKRT